MWVSGTLPLAVRSNVQVHDECTVTFRVQRAPKEAEFDPGNTSHARRLQKTAQHSFAFREIKYLRTEPKRNLPTFQARRCFSSLGDDVYLLKFLSSRSPGKEKHSRIFFQCIMFLAGKERPNFRFPRSFLPLILSISFLSVPSPQRRHGFEDVFHASRDKTPDARLDTPHCVVVLLLSRCAMPAAAAHQPFVVLAACLSRPAFAVGLLNPGSVISK